MFKKALISKIISFFIAAVFLFNTAVYGADGVYLRKPLDFNAPSAVDERWQSAVISTVAENKNLTDPVPPSLSNMNLKFLTFLLVPALAAILSYTIIKNAQTPENAWFETAVTGTESKVPGYSDEDEKILNATAENFGKKSGAEQSIWAADTGAYIAKTVTVDDTTSLSVIMDNQNKVIAFTFFMRNRDSAIVIENKRGTALNALIKLYSSREDISSLSAILYTEKLDADACSSIIGALRSLAMRKDKFITEEILSSLMHVFRTKGLDNLTYSNAASLLKQIAIIRPDLITEKYFSILIAILDTEGQGMPVYFNVIDVLRHIAIYRPENIPEKVISSLVTLFNKILETEKFPNNVYYAAADGLLGLSKNNSISLDLRKKALNILKEDYKTALSRMPFEPDIDSPEIMNIVDKSLENLLTDNAEYLSTKIKNKYNRPPQKILFYLTMPEVVTPLVKAYKQIRIMNPEISFEYFVAAAFAEGYIVYAQYILKGEMPFGFEFNTVTPLGLDRFGSEENDLKKFGYLRKDFSGFHKIVEPSGAFGTYTNEADDTFYDGTFSDIESVLEAFGALLAQDRARFLTNAKKLGYNTKKTSEDQIRVGTYLFYCSRNAVKYLRENGPNLVGKTGSGVHGDGRYNAQWPAATAELLENLGILKTTPQDLEHRLDRKKDGPYNFLKPNNPSIKQNMKLEWKKLEDPLWREKNPILAANLYIYFMAGQPLQASILPNKNLRQGL